MSATLADIIKSSNPTNKLWNDLSFLKLMEFHLDYLRGHPKTTIVEVPENIQYQFQGDFTQVANALKIKPEYHWLCMRLTGLTNYLFDPENPVTHIVVADQEAINDIIRIHMTA